MMTRPRLSPNRVRSILYFLLLVLPLSGGCFKNSTSSQSESTVDSKTSAPTNRTALPAVVRHNLGITFARAEYRPVASNVTLPGFFEVLPSAQHHYPVPAAGRVTVHVQPLDEVEKNQLLLEIDAPDWRALQLELVEARAIRLNSEAKAVQARAAWLAAGAIEPSDPTVPDVFTAEIRAAEAAVETAEDRLAQLLAKASTLTGLAPEELSRVVDEQPYWRKLARLPIRASQGGLVREVDAATGTWVAEGTEVVHIVQRETLRFRARALQADLIDHLRDGQSALIYPPRGRGAARRVEPLSGTIRIGVTGDPDRRTTDVFVDFEESKPWVHPQVVGVAEVLIEGSRDPIDLAIPARALIQDGLETVFFRRDPSDKDTVIRTVADLGISDGRWTTILSGIGEGDEVVIDGVYQLKLATSGQEVVTGHFHADGTFHEEDH